MSLMHETKLIRNKRMNRCFYSQKPRESVYDSSAFAVNINLLKYIEQKI